MFVMCLFKFNSVFQFDKINTDFDKINAIFDKIKYMNDKINICLTRQEFANFGPKDVTK